MNGHTIPIEVACRHPAPLDALIHPSTHPSVSLPQWPCGMLPGRKKERLKPCKTASSLKLDVETSRCGNEYNFMQKVSTVFVSSHSSIVTVHLQLTRAGLDSSTPVCSEVLSLFCLSSISYSCRLSYTHKIKGINGGGLHVCGSHQIAPLHRSIVGCCSMPFFLRGLA